MEEFRRCRLQDLAVLIQTKYRSYWMRRRYLASRNSQIVIARAWRTWRVSETMIISGRFSNRCAHDLL